MHHFGFQLGLQGLDLPKHSEATGGAAHLTLQQVEDFMQPFGSGPEGRVLLSGGDVQMHGGSNGLLDIMIMFAGDLGQ
jgi:hypothetical protein